MHQQQRCRCCKTAATAALPKNATGQRQEPANFKSPMAWAVWARVTVPAAKAPAATAAMPTAALAIMASGGNGGYGNSGNGGEHRLRHRKWR